MRGQIPIHMRIKGSMFSDQDALLCPPSLPADSRAFGSKLKEEGLKHGDHEKNRLRAQADSNLG